MRKRYLANDVAIAPVLLPAASLQREKEILNSAVTFKLQRDPRHGISAGKKFYQRMKRELAPDRRGRRLYYKYRGLRSWFDRGLRPVGEHVLTALGITGLSLVVRAEQAPNPHSRVRLSNRKDVLGPALPGTGLASVFPGHGDGHGARRYAAVGVYAPSGMGRLQKSAWVGEPASEWPVDLSVGNHPIGGYHHMGTTRMSTDPETGGRGR